MLFEDCHLDGLQLYQQNVIINGVSTQLHNCEVFADMLSVGKTFTFDVSGVWIAIVRRGSGNSAVYIGGTTTTAIPILENGDMDILEITYQQEERTVTLKNNSSGTMMIFVAGKISLKHQ